MKSPKPIKLDGLEVSIDFAASLTKKEWAKFAKGKLSSIGTEEAYETIQNELKKAGVKKSPAKTRKPKKKESSSDGDKPTIQTD